MKISFIDQWSGTNCCFCQQQLVYLCFGNEEKYYCNNCFKTSIKKDGFDPLTGCMLTRPPFRAYVQLIQHLPHVCNFYIDLDTAAGIINDENGFSKSFRLRTFKYYSLNELKQIFNTFLAEELLSNQLEYCLKNNCFESFYLKMREILSETLL